MKTPIPHERRRSNRKFVNFYLPVMESDTQKVIGHMVDISLIGFMMDSKVAIPSNLVHSLHIDFMENIAGRSFFDFHARSVWCRPDRIQPYLYDAGFAFIDLTEGDLEVIRAIAEKYGAG